MNQLQQYGIIAVADRLAQIQILKVGESHQLYSINENQIVPMHHGQYVETKKQRKKKKTKCNMMISFTFLLVLVEYTAKFTHGLTTFDNILLVGNPKLAEIFHFSSLNQRHLCRSWWTGAFKMNVCLKFLAVLSNLQSYIFLFRCIDNHDTH